MLLGNFGDYPVLRIDEMPVVEVYIVPREAESGGVGEPGVPRITPADLTRAGRENRLLP